MVTVYKKFYASLRLEEMRNTMNKHGHGNQFSGLYSKLVPFEYIRSVITEAVRDNLTRPGPNGGVLILWSVQ